MSYKSSKKTASSFQDEEVDFDVCHANMLRMIKLSMDITTLLLLYPETHFHRVWPQEISFVFLSFSCVTLCRFFSLAPFSTAVAVEAKPPQRPLQPAGSDEDPGVSEARSGEEAGRM